MTVTRLLAVLCLVAPALTGCTDPAPTPAYEVGGTFTEETDQADLEDLGDRLEPYEADLTVLESFPMQYRIRVPGGQADCQAISAMLHQLAYIAEVGQCLERLEAEDGDQPASS